HWKHLRRTAHRVAAWQQVLQDALSLVLELRANVFVVPATTVDLGLLVGNGALEGVETVVLVEQPALLLLGLQFSDLALEASDGSLADESRYLTLPAAVPFLFLLSGGPAVSHQPRLKRLSDRGRVCLDERLQVRFNVFEQLACAVEVGARSPVCAA